MIKIQHYSATELDSFRNYQRQTFGILESIATSLELGMSENQVTRALRKAFHLAGAHNYFHVPVALFGERTSYPGDFGEFEALSTDHRLCEGDDRIREVGFENCHRKHIGAVLGHRVTKVESTRLSSWSYKGLAVKQVAWFLTRSRLAGKRFGTVTPNWNHTNTCKDIAPHGLWAVEPHLATKGVGVKFEELLLIDDNGAEWLDDDLPHHRRWATASSL